MDDASYGDLILEGERIRETGNPTAAIPIFNNALLKAITPTEKSNALRHIGLCYEHENDLTNACAFYHNAQSISDDPADVARTQRHLLSVHLKRQEYWEAYSLGKDAYMKMVSVKEIPTDIIWITHGIVKTMIEGKFSMEEVRRWTALEFENLKYMLPREKNKIRRRVWLTGFMMDASHAYAPLGWILVPIAFLIALFSNLKLRVRQFLTGKR